MSETGATDPEDVLAIADDQTAQLSYRAFPEKWAEIKHWVACLLADELVEESRYHWDSQVVLVKKKGGQWRFCMDNHHLNSDCQRFTLPPTS